MMESCNQLVNAVDARVACGQLHNPTVAENIDNRIAQFENEIIRLKAVKAKLESGDIASIPIQDLRNAMSY